MQEGSRDSKRKAVRDFVKKISFSVKLSSVRSVVYLYACGVEILIFRDTVELKSERCLNE